VPNEAESFSVAVLSTAKEKYFYLCELCASSGAGGELSLTQPLRIAEGLMS
jgi:hypothetical protein